MKESFPCLRSLEIKRYVVGDAMIDGSCLQVTFDVKHMNLLLVFNVSGRGVVKLDTS